jgi:peptidoglycan/xylan/chitin deacetylase (PgdA/CDA1 family)
MKRFALIMLALILASAAAVPQAGAFGVISPVFDDQDISTWEVARPIMGGYGVLGSIAVIPSEVGEEGRMSWQQLWLVHNQRQWEIINHTFSHPDLTTLPNAKIKAQIMRAENAFANHGLMTGRALAPPFGAFDARVVDFLKKSGIVSSIRQAWAEGDGVNYPATFNRFSIEAFSVKSSTTFDEIKEKIDIVVANDGLFVPVIHGVSWAPTDESIMNAAVLKQTCQYLHELQKADKGHSTTLSHGVAHIMQVKSHR